MVAFRAQLDCASQAQLRCVVTRRARRFALSLAELTRLERADQAEVRLETEGWRLNLVIISVAEP